MAGSLPVEALRWADGRLQLLDQERLPSEELWLSIATVEELVIAIQRLAVRGAPALGCAAAYGCVTAVLEPGPPVRDSLEWFRRLQQGAAEIAEARPTAVNLAHGVSQMLAVGVVAVGQQRTPEECSADLLKAAQAYHAEDRALCAAIGEHGLSLLPEPATVLTHCNAGALATGGLGTALAPLHLAASRGRSLHVFADETRPLRQGARLTAWELARSGIPTTVLCDGAAAGLLASGRIDLVIVGSDRIAANGDVANKIGTYGLALAAHAHGVPFYVAAPSTTYDLDCANGKAIPIEQRAAGEVLLDDRIDGVDAWNPAFDVTPAELVTAWVTERGIHRSAEDLRAAMQQTL